MAEKEGGKKPHSKSKHKSIQIWKRYKDAKTQGKWCPRCGAGTMLAEHGNRITCGKCHYSEIKVKKAE
jgi:small subunit ribosomal protein S27Ae